jgi:dehydrogenase/reductase SDR family protein 12
MRSLWQGAEGICWLAVVPSERLVPGAFYLDRKPQQKHITGTFNSDGGFTRNTSD